MENNEKKYNASISLNEFKVLKFIYEHSKDARRLAESEVSIPDMEKIQIASSISWLESKNLISVHRKEESYFSLSEEGSKFLKAGLPEEKIYEHCASEGSFLIGELAKHFGEKDLRVALAQLSKYGIKPDHGKIAFERNEDIEKDILNKKIFLENLSKGNEIRDKEMLERFKKRSGVIIEKKRTVREISITPPGVKALSQYSESGQIEEITSGIISSGVWKEKKFRDYDLTSQVESRTGSFLHPLTLLTSEIKKIFVGMGFTEMPGHYIEYSGWNMDALFIPQDHPARDMQDTFFLKSQKKPVFEHPEVLKILKKVHESGIKGYRGWEYEWSEAKAMDLLLRTHTTVSTIRYLYEHPEPPVAVFSVDKVFRHESVDWKHLAELNQIEGAYYGKDANLSTLKWLMTEFYGRLGFSKLKFIPSYYPYTEPSMDVVAYLDGKEVELGGSGVFRPEVTKPLGLKGRVIAWGLGLERLAMLYYGLDDVRKIYQSDIEWLRTYSVVNH